MTILTKVIAGSDCRKTRAHSEKGDFGLRSPSDYSECWASFRTCCARLMSGNPPVLPWLTYPAIKFLEKNLATNAKVFEFGGGMSTLWYERHVAQVHTVEDNPAWYQMLQSRAPTAHLMNLTGEDYIKAIDRFDDGFFDMIVVDGSIDRLSCFERGERHLRSGGFMVVDDTDKEQTARKAIRKLDELLAITGNYDVQRFIGWVPGLFLVKETTIAIKR